ncbi:Uncharacterised protein [Halioglobus japonicus]|nr:Uncharacterised protein [Halioglobus japonicus]
MPIRKTKTPEGTHQTLKNMSYENGLVSWLMYDGWQVFSPVVDHGHKTDILVSDGPNYHRIQVKTIDAQSEDHIIENRWEGSHVGYVIYIARNSTWGYVMPAFEEPRRPMNHSAHKRFLHQDRKSFLKAFHAFDM